MRAHLLSVLSVLFFSSGSSSLELIESRALNLCSDSLSLTAEHFNVVFTPQNQSMALSLDGSSKITGFVKAELVLTVYGYEALRKILDPCDMSLDGLCPVRAGPLPMMSTNIKIPENVVSQIPRIAYSVPDLDASVRVYINSTETGEEITCIEAALSNGKSVYQVGVGWTTAIISGLGLTASAITSSLGYSKAATHITASVVSLFGFMQSQAMFGMMSVHMPPIVQSWAQNFQWSMGIIHIGFLEKICTWYQRSTGGVPSTILSNLTVTSVHVMKKRSSEILRHASELLKRTGQKRNATYGATIVVRGIQRVGFRAGIEVTNIFLTGLIFFVVFVAVMMLLVAAFKEFCDIRARSGGENTLKTFRQKWTLVAKGVIFRLVLIGFPQMLILCLWEFTQHDSPAEVLLAAVTLLGMMLSIGFAAFRVIRLARRSLVTHQNPAYLLYSNAPFLSRWGFLYMHYKATTYYFIVPSLSYTFLRAAFISLSQEAPVVQTVGLLVVQTGMLVVVSVCRPWMNKKTNIYNISITALNFINTIFLLFFADVFDQPGLVTGVMGVVFFVFNTVFILVLLVLILMDSVHAILSKNPDIRYQPMQDDRDSFVRSHSQLVTSELHALGATARGDPSTALYKVLQGATDNDNDPDSLATNRKKTSTSPPNGGHSSGDVTLHERQSPTSVVDLSVPLFPSGGGPGQEDRKVRRQSSSPM
ncbi:putative flavin carrier protein 3 [Aspergillus melleus]|uniref:Flavin carrier protein 3 n=1 Tax=Aspergillus melleus TaxID=138277 RepID=A0ACC3ANI8_9EURO|nr:putative flavin carrier protein 3 [Aspergillus melleus]